jgi:high-affinity nickel-transport protein
VVTLVSLIALGFFLGMRHATDADHVVAIATIVSRQRRLGAAAAIGALWGVGHTVTVAIVGSAIIVFGFVIPPRLGLAMEFAVGVMLVLLGLVTLSAVARQARESLALYMLHGTHADGSTRANGHTHVHTHGDYVHSHAHGHGDSEHGHAEQATPQAWLDRHLGEFGLYQIVRPMVVGVVHGLAGSAAVALMALAAIRDPWWGLLYLAVFGLGTIAGMMLITVVIAAPFAYSAARLPVINAGVRAFAGVLSLVFGLVLMYQIGIVSGLFSATPQWSPH